MWTPSANSTKSVKTNVPLRHLLNVRDPARYLKVVWSKDSIRAWRHKYTAAIGVWVHALPGVFCKLDTQRLLLVQIWGQIYSHVVAAHPGHTYVQVGESGGIPPFRKC